MRLPFRQGLVQYPTNCLQKVNNDVVISTTNGPIIITLSNGTAEYYHAEPQVTNQYIAWTGLASGTDCWLYFDINKSTGSRTFGQTTLEPIDGNVAPASPAVDQHWFDTNTMTTKVWSGSVWVEHIRVFFAQITGTNTFTYYTTGTQVGVATSYDSGRILFDGFGVAIKQSTGKFMTTEDQFFVDGATIQSSRLEATVISAIADETIPAYSVVKYNSFDRIGLAQYEDISNTVIALVVDDTFLGDTANLVLQGIVVNPSWNWSSVNAPLWVDTAGQLTDVDPNTINSLRPKAVPIARVIAHNTIIFEQGMGGRGATGAPGSSSASVLPASTTTLGTVLLATIPTDTNNPVAVGNNDPRLTNPRTPTAHTHAATEVSYIGHGTIPTGTTQAAVDALEDTKLNITGGTLTGPLTLVGDPTSILQPATKQYVDSRVSGLVWIDPIQHVNLIADNLNAPPVSPGYTDVYIISTGGSGAWVGLSGHMVRWSGTEWTDLGLPTNGLRLGIAMETTTTPSGAFLNKKNQIAIWNQTLSSWSFYNPVGNNATFVSNSNSLHSFHQYVFDATHASWIEFGGPQAIQPGTHLQLSGNILNVIDGIGSTLNADMLDGLHASSFSSATHDHDVTYVKLSGSIMTGSLTLNANPSSSLHAATKQYVDTQNLTKVNKAGDTMTGTLTLAGAPTAALHAATKQYVDDVVIIPDLSSRVAKAGDTMLGSLILNADPVTALEAATKQYVDNFVPDLSSRVATAGDTMTGPLVLPGDPTADFQAATKQYVDNSIPNVSGFVTKTGDTMSGTLTVYPYIVGKEAAGTTVGTTGILRLGATAQVGMSLKSNDSSFAYLDFVNSTDQRTNITYTFGTTLLEFGKYLNEVTGAAALSMNLSTGATKTKQTVFSDNQEYVTKGYVDGAVPNVSSKVSKTGDSMSGPLTTTSNILVTNSNITVNDGATDLIIIDGPTGHIQTTKGTVTVSRDPLTDFEVATKQYVDTAATAATSAIMHYVHMQPTTSSTWNIAHNLNTTNMVMSTYINASGNPITGLKEVFPLDTTFVDENNITIDFTTPQSGKVVIIAVPTVVAPAPTYTYTLTAGQVAGGGSSVYTGADPTGSIGLTFGTLNPIPLSGGLTMLNMYTYGTNPTTASSFTVMLSYGTASAGSTDFTSISFTDELGVPRVFQRSMSNDPNGYVSEPGREWSWPISPDVQIFAPGSVYTVTIT